MNIKVYPGQLIIFSLIGTDKKAHPVVTTALKVCGKTITVTEEDSQNGTACIVCSFRSDTISVYSYEYTNKEGKRETGHILNLYAQNDSKESTEILGRFIEDS